MPILSYPEDASGAALGALDLREAGVVSPDIWETVSAAFRQDNIVASAGASKTNGIDLLEKEDGYTGDLLWKDIEGTRYEPHWGRFAGVFNRRGTEAMKAQIDMEMEDRRTLDAAGGWGMAASFGAAMLDLPSLIPGGTIVRGAATGARIGRAAISAGGAAALAAGVSEYALQATQETRPLAESAVAIGAGAILGAGLGAGAGALFSRAERQAAYRAIEQVRQSPAADDAITEFRAGAAEGVGAEAVSKDSLEDLTIAKGARAVGKSTAKLNPVLRAAQSPSAVHRSVMANLQETGFYFEKNMRGEGDIAVETAVKYWDRGALGKAIEETGQIYRDARKAGMGMDSAEFRFAVSQAMRRGDEGSNDAVTKAARTWRSRLFDPLKDEAIEVGLLPADVHPSTAMSYLSRLWSTPRLEAGEGRFKQIVRGWLDDKLSELQFKAEEIRIGNRVVDSDKARSRYDKSFSRLSEIENRLANRTDIRKRKTDALAGAQQTRFDVMKERAPEGVVKALRGADEGAALVDAVKEARAAARSANRKQTYAQRFPVLATIKAKGGVRVGSALDGNLRAMGVTPKTHPGLFTKKGGIGDVDNFVRSKDELFAGLPDDGAGYVDRNALMDAVRGEVAGSPLRSTSDIATADAVENLDRLASQWLENVGLPENATVRQVRDYIARVTGAERDLDALDARVSRLEREIEDFDTATDKIRNERDITNAEAAQIAEEVEALEAELADVADIANASPRVKLVVDYATTKRDLFRKKLERQTKEKRIAAIRRLEADGRANDEMLAELVAKNADIERLNGEIAGLKAKADKLEPMVPKIRQELPDFVSAADRQDYVNQIADDIFNTLTGRARQGALTYDLTIAARGPLKERTFNIPDELVEDFLENDIELIARRYARVMSADVELTRKFGKATMEDQIAEVTADYQKLRDEVMASDKAAGAKEKEMRRLADRERRDINDIAGIRDVLRGQYKIDQQNSNFARIVNTAMAFNYVRAMGGVLASSLTDVVRPAMTNGLGRYMREGIAPLLTNLKAVKLAKEDAKTLGAVTEQVLMSRIATMAELADPYQMRSPFERMLNNATTTFSKMTLLPWWNDVQKTIASVLVQNRLVRNAMGDFDALPAKEKAYMGLVGIDRFMAERIGRMFDQFGQVEGTVHVPNVERWTDEGAVRAFAAALNKDVDSTIITKGAGDVPLFMQTPAGRALGQFKSFALASNQRALMRGLQEGPGSALTGFIGMSALGMMVYWLKQTEAGRDVSDNPGTWIMEGVDRAGLLAIGMEVNNVFERLGGPGLYHFSAKMFPNRSQKQPASRFATRGTVDALMGPTIGLAKDVTDIAGIGARALRDRELDLTAGDVGTMRRLTPFASLPYWRWLIDGALVPELKEELR